MNREKTAEKYLYKVAIGAICSLGLQACANNPIDERKPLNSDLPPVEQPDWPVGTHSKGVNRINGEDSSWRIQSIDLNGSITGQSSDGCKWTNQADWFAPALAWEECGTHPTWHTGTRTIDKQKGNIWPLAVGNKVQYKHTYVSSAGEKSNNVDNCEVLGVVQIDTTFGELDTFKIRCRRSWESTYEDRIWYWSPEYRDVKYIRRHSKDGVKSHSDRISLEIPGS